MNPFDVGPHTLSEDLARVDRETADLLSSVAEMTVGDLAEPSRCAGWSRAHVLAHLARNADSLVNLATWATTGVATPQYPSTQARDAEIERTAALGLADLVAEVQESAARCREGLAALAGDLRAPTVQLRSGAMISAYELPVRRVNELVIHHFDLRTRWTLEDASPQSLLGALRDSVHRLRQHPDVPSMTLRVEEGEDVQEYRVGQPPGSGTPTVVVRGSRAAMVAWLTRGVTAKVAAEATLPSLPSWG